MAKAWCPHCDELISIYGNGKDPTLTTKRQRFIVHRNKKTNEPVCKGSGEDT